MNLSRASHASTSVQVLCVEDVGDYYRDLAQEMSYASGPNDPSSIGPLPGPSRLPPAGAPIPIAPFAPGPVQHFPPPPWSPPSPPLATPSRDDRAELARAAALARRISARRAGDAGYAYPGPPPATPAESGLAQLRRAVGSRWAFLPGANLAGAQVWDHEAGVVIGAAGVGTGNELSSRRASLPVSVDARRRYSEAPREYGPGPSNWNSQQGIRSQVAVQNFRPRDALDRQRHPGAGAALGAQTHWLGHTPYDRDHGGMRIRPAAARGSHGAASSHSSQSRSPTSPYRHKPAWGHQPLWRVHEPSVNANGQSKRPERAYPMHSNPNMPPTTPDAQMLRDPSAQPARNHARSGRQNVAYNSLLRDEKDSRDSSGVFEQATSTSQSPRLSVVTAVAPPGLSPAEPTLSGTARRPDRVPSRSLRLSLLDEPTEGAGVLYGPDGLCTASERRTLYEFERLMLERRLVAVFALRSSRKLVKGDGDSDSEYYRWRWRCTLSVVEPFPSQKWVLPGAQVVRGTRCEAKAAAAAKALAALARHSSATTASALATATPDRPAHSESGADAPVNDLLGDDYDTVTEAALPIIVTCHETDIDNECVDLDLGSVGVHTPSHGSLTPFPKDAGDLDLDLLSFGSALFPERSVSAMGERLRWIGEGRPVSPDLNAVTVIRSASR